MFNLSPQEFQENLYDYFINGKFPPDELKKLARSDNQTDKMEFITQLFFQCPMENLTRLYLGIKNIVGFDISDQNLKKFDLDLLLAKAVKERIDWLAQSEPDFEKCLEGNFRPNCFSRFEQLSSKLFSALTPDKQKLVKTNLQTLTNLFNSRNKENELSSIPGFTHKPYTRTPNETTPTPTNRNLLFKPEAKKASQPTPKRSSRWCSLL